ncbi:hypothetical protein JCM5296_003763 [Sporobolomyces johnsonii]
MDEQMIPPRQHRSPAPSDSTDSSAFSQATSAASTWPSSLAPTLPLPVSKTPESLHTTSAFEVKQPFFPVRAERPGSGRLRRRQSEGDEHGRAGELTDDTEDIGLDDGPLSVLEFVAKDQTDSERLMAEAQGSGLGLFKRPGIEGLSLTPASAPPPEPPSIPVSTTSELLPSDDDDSSPPGTDEAPRKPKFERFTLPSAHDITLARDCELIGESGMPITFQRLVKERKRVVWVHLRHAWCGLCAQYVRALRDAMLSLVTFERSTSSLSSDDTSSTASSHDYRPVIPPLYIVLVSTGSYKLIPTYRHRLDCPFPLYVDRSRKLYTALGMTKKTWSMGKASEKGSYIKQSNWENVVESTKAGLAMRHYPGPQTQLGGEFVFEWSEEDESITCTYASRMHTTRSHAEIRELFAAAGVHLNDEDAASVYGESVSTWSGE